MYLLWCMSLLVWVNYTYSCRCMPVHPGKKFCEAPFVFEGTVEGAKEFRPSPFDYNGSHKDVNIYTVRINKVYRTNYQEIATGNTIKVYAPGQLMSCRTSLKMDVTYLIAPLFYDGKISIETCDWVEVMTSLTAKQLEGINGGYDCTCDYDNFYVGEGGDENTCHVQKYTGFHEYWCKYDHGSCSRDEDGVCRWKIDTSKCGLN